jgi:putative membrane protein
VSHEGTPNKEVNMMPYGWHDGASGVIWMILSWGLIIAVLWVLMRAFTPDSDRRQRPRDPKEILAERFAKGEIDAEEYHERLRVLEGIHSPTTNH